MVTSVVQLPDIESNDLRQSVERKFWFDHTYLKRYTLGTTLYA